MIATPYGKYLKIVIDPYIDRAFKGGRYLNPIKVQGVPVAPLSAALLPAFFSVRDDWTKRLQAVPLPVAAGDMAKK